MTHTSNAMILVARVVQGPLLRVRPFQRAHLTTRRCSPVFCASRHYATPFRRAAPGAEQDISAPARTRFAPSPTGYLHIGSLRTALYNYLLARATGGQFLIRIEDTDRTRLVPDAEDRLFRDLKWAGLDWDEGPGIEGPFGPYRQSDRLPIYESHAKQLLDEGKAYRCFCKPEELDRLKQQQLASGVHAQYPGTCSHISAGESDRRAASGEAHCIRFKAGDGRPSVKDLVYGTYVRDGVSEDLIIIKRDGFPTYHFANVVDDHLMEISHVIRGAEWLPSTPRHVQLYDAFGWTPPKFAHVALLVNSERQKLSKRHGDIDIASWRDKGYLPVAMLNYVLLLGWSHGRGPKGSGGKVKGHKEVMDLEQMIANFHLRFTKGDIVVNDKHDHIQKEHMVRLATADNHAPFFAHTLPFIEKAIKKVELYRQTPPSATSPDDSGRPEALFLNQFHQLDLGELVPQARWAEQDAQSQDMSSVLPYVQNALALDRKNYKTAETYVMKHCYMLWQIPPAEHLRTLQEGYKEFSQLLVVPSGESASAAADSDGGNDNAVPANPAALVRDFRDRLAGVDIWERDAIAERVDPFVKSLRTSVGGVLKVSGYHLVRWIINALRPGPSLVDSMVVLGRDEVMLRANQAVEIIEQAEKSGQL
ncbi:uncharacterized protein B0I36DRAFT_73772 [Microdochium trichocladiopsis]|uniref:Glutamate--tRNA ligase, mitochondrial n=1 Tax=Microdochium trichocladiopsis TaxID=1682393 RepID=A0A9P8YFK7_9PEZI|nr:uncharacterized protein B0I36DRAFT_73772 [Microdochium trichocladiopsis]KAH7037997.1 hypothetical protein B0I36DRAFT_73772 [Microdochium trichocladiopsis]